MCGKQLLVLIVVSATLIWAQQQKLYDNDFLNNVPDIFGPIHSNTGNGEEEIHVEVLFISNVPDVQKKQLALKMRLPDRIFPPTASIFPLLNTALYPRVQRKEIQSWYENHSIRPFVEKVRILPSITYDMFNENALRIHFSDSTIKHEMVVSIENWFNSKFEKRLNYSMSRINFTKLAETIKKE